MTEIISIEEMVREDYLPLVSLNSYRKINILGNNGSQTDRVAKAFYNQFRTQSLQNTGCSSFPKKGYEKNDILKGFALEETENLTIMGAIAADRCGEDGEVYDIACGIPTPSIAYNALTGRVANAIDNDDGILSIGKGIVSKLKKSVNFHNSTVEEYMEGVHLGPQDVVIASSLTPELFYYIIDLLKENEFFLIMHGTLPGNVSSFVKTNFVDNGYNAKVAKNNSINNLVIKGNLTRAPPQQYIFLASKE